MLQNKILVQYHYIPLNKFKIFKGKYITKNAKIYYKSTLSLPIYPDLSLKDQNYIIKKLKFFLNLMNRIAIGTANFNQKYGLIKSHVKKLVQIKDY